MGAHARAHAHFGSARPASVTRRFRARGERAPDARQTLETIPRQMIANGTIHSAQRLCRRARRGGTVTFAAPAGAAGLRAAETLTGSITAAATVDASYGHLVP